MKNGYKHFVPHNLGRRIEDAAFEAISDGELVSLDPVTLGLEDRVGKSREAFTLREVAAWGNSVTRTFDVATREKRTAQRVAEVFFEQGKIDGYKLGELSRLGWMGKELGESPILYEVSREDVGRDWLVGPWIEAEELLSVLGFLYSRNDCNP